MTQISQVYEIAVAMDGTPQPLTIQPPGNVFSTWKALVIANNSGFVGVLQGVDDNFLSQPAIQPLTQDLYPYNNVRGSLTVVWPLGAVGGVPQPPTLTATFTDDPKADFAGKSYPSPLATTTVVSVSDLYNPVPIQTTGGGGGGGGMLAFLAATSAVPYTDPIVWDIGINSDYAYFDVGSENIISLPEHSFTHITFSLFNDAAGSPSSSASLELDLDNGSGTPSQQSPAQFGLGLTGDDIEGIRWCPNGWMDLDSDNLPGGGLPFFFAGSASGWAESDSIAFLSIMSWAKP